MKLIKKFLAPVSIDEDKKRREFILNVLLLTGIILFAAAIMVNTFAALYRPASHEQSSLPTLFLLGALIVFSCLYFLSRKGQSHVSAYIFIFLFFVLAFFMSFKWGVDVNASLLLYSLLIVMAGILVSTRFSFIVTSIITISLIVIGGLQKSGTIIVNDYWRLEPWQESDTFMTVIIFFSVAIVSWLSNREIEKSLTRARHSEKLLKEERDSLEEAVIKRTKELREAETEKISQLYRFAEFGRLSSGLFHDLISPLSAVSLNVERAKGEDGTSESIEKTQKYLDQAVVAARRMDAFIAAVRKQLAKKKESKLFSLRENTGQVIEILSYKAHLAGVKINFHSSGDLRIFGEEMKWNQLALNLITNAIDAYDEIPENSQDEKIVTVHLDQTENEIIFSVLDHGLGILPGNMQKIFEPFFSTKNESTTKGIGLGLSMTKNIAEKDFGGKITVVSDRNNTTFSVILLA